MQYFPRQAIVGIAGASPALSALLQAIGGWSMPSAAPGPISSVPEYENWAIGHALIVQVADLVLQQADIQPGGAVAVVLVTETGLSVRQVEGRQQHLVWQMEPEYVGRVKALGSRAVHRFLIHRADRMAHAIAARWSFTGPAFTLTVGENSLFKALEIVQRLLATQGASAALLGTVEHGWGREAAPVTAGALVLKPYATAQQNQIYAVLDRLIQPGY
ncbi:hypothetical protein [Anthocerotibacter panamensis]|uniref:hypothetical protein n=1 Tax=Anthocerotibacter panamensis TaxID=2857077 RepID=UPI001C4039AC|nr:hypothetical protein [Anthocerotibacter panamensis]